MMRKTILSLIVTLSALCLTTQLSAQAATQKTEKASKKDTAEKVQEPVGEEKKGAFDYKDIESGKFRQKTVSGGRSMADGEHYIVLSNNNVLKYSYATGQMTDTLFNAANVLNGKKMRVYDYELSPDGSRALVRFNSVALYRRSAHSIYAVYDTQSNSLEFINDSRAMRYATLAPTGDKVAYVYENNIYVYDITADATTQVTTDGKLNSIIYGVPDWVYEEEFSLYNSLSWSPDGTTIAFLRFDETEVREYVISYCNIMTNEELEQYYAGNKSMPAYPTEFKYKYPKAGEKNSEVELYTYDVAQQNTVKVDVGEEKDQYVPFFDWTPDSQLYFFRINRLQNHLEVILADKTGKGRVIYDEKSGKYIDNIGRHTITFLADSKRFIVHNETRTGYSHLYMYDINKGYRYAITKGKWEVTSVVCSTEDNIWYMSTEGSSLRRDLYSIDLQGKNKKRLTDGNGTYRIVPSEGFKYYISYFSNSTTPNTVTLHEGDGSLVRVLEDNADLKAYIAELNLPKKEFFTYSRNVDGKKIDYNYFIIKPVDFDANKKYPVLITQYSGPGSQQVLDRWTMDWEEVMVQNGYIVACMDPRGTGGRGEEFKKLTYGRLGLIETEDHIAFARSLAERSYVDESRVAIYGWSYGGFMSLNCILHGSDVFKTAISVAPVTSWRYYDSVYTERYNGLPQDNAAGYDEPSPINHADKLNGNLLLMHGSADDNVHVQNSYKIAYEFIYLGKDFDMMIYPDDNHSMVPNGRKYIHHKMIEYCLENL